jgi:hypothetical protein
MASSQANLFMDRFLAQEPTLPLVWKHYVHPLHLVEMSFPESISDERIEFLDLSIQQTT